MNTKMKEIIDAIASNNARSVQKVLSSLQDWISIRINQEYDTLLHLVVYNSNEEVLKIFLNSCNTPDIKNCYDESPLHIASHLGSTSKIKMLLDYGANPNLKDINGWTPLHKAVLSGNAESLGALIERGADLDCADRNGNTALHLALEEGNKCNLPASSITDLACIQELIVKGANLEVKNIALEKPVHLACLHGDHESLKLLLEKRAEFRSTTRGGDTPLTYAIKKDSIKCVDLLYKLGIPIKESDARLALEKAMIKMWQHLKKLQATQKPVVNQYETLAEVQTLDREEHDNLDYKYSFLRLSDYRINNLTINMRDASFNDYSSNMELEKLKLSKLSQKYFESNKIGFPQEKVEGTSSIPAEYASIYFENQRLQTEIEKLQHQLLGNGTGEKVESKYDIETAPLELVTPTGTHLNKNDVQTLELLILKLRDNANKFQNSEKSKQEDLCDKYHDLVDNLESWLKTTLKQQAITSQMSTQSGSSTQVEQEMISVKDIKLHEKIGVGANAVVHRAIWQGEEVAVKKIYRKGINAKELEKVFWKEVSIMKKIRHPKIVLFMGISQTDDHYYIVTEFMPKKSLEYVLKDEKIVLDNKIKLRMALDIAKAICFLHSAVPAILHRDLKTANCLCDDALNIKIADFGLAKMLDNNLNTTSIATVKYMAPEFITKQIFTAKSDVFSFGMIVWEIFARKEPFDNLNPTQAIYAIANNKRPDIPKSMPADVKKIVEACWHQEAEKRPDFNVILEKLQEAASALN